MNNNDKNKRINAKNANQLFFIIDFLIEYINNKEKIYKDKTSDSFNNLDLMNNVNYVNNITKKNYTITGSEKNI